MRWVLLLVAFMLGSCKYAKLSPETIASASAGVTDLDLPEALTGEAERGGEQHIVVSRSKVMLAGDAVPIATIPSDPALGLAAEDKRDGRDDMLVLPLVHALRWRIEHDPDADAGHPGATASPGLEAMIGGNGRRPVVVVADAQTPYRIVTEVLASALHVAGEPLAIAMHPPGNPKMTAMMTIASPQLADLEGHAYEAATVWLRETGAQVFVGDNEVATGCDDGGVGPAVKRAPGAPYDFGALKRCMQVIIAAVPATATVTARVGGEPGTPLRDVAGALDVLRLNLFEKVTLTTRRPRPSRGPKRGIIVQ